MKTFCWLVVCFWRICRWRRSDINYGYSANVRWVTRSFIDDFWREFYSSLVQWLHSLPRNVTSVDRLSSSASKDYDALVLVATDLDQLKEQVDHSILKNLQEFHQVRSYLFRGESFRRKSFLLVEQKVRQRSHGLCQRSGARQTSRRNSHLDEHRTNIFEFPLDLFADRKNSSWLWWCSSICWCCFCWHEESSVTWRQSATDRQFWFGQIFSSSPSDASRCVGTDLCGKTEWQRRSIDRRDESSVRCHLAVANTRR